jgi:hypothetical protein
MSASQLTSHTTRKALAGLAGLTLAASALAGCGSSAPSHSATVVSAASATRESAANATPARATPAPSNADVGSASAQIKAGKGASKADAASVAASGTAGASSGSSGPAASSHAASSHAADRVSRGHGVQHARSTPSSSNDDPSNAGVRPINPCRLVTAPEARSITAGGITGITEAPLGPTCIYHSTKAKSPSITMTVEVMKLAQVTQKLNGKAQFTIKSHPAYCGKLGTQMLFVPLTNGQVLNVVAPCSVARQFAAVALGRLAA